MKNLCLLQKMMAKAGIEMKYWIEKGQYYKREEGDSGATPDTHICRGTVLTAEQAVIGYYNGQPEEGKELIFHNLSKIFGRITIKGECPYCKHVFSYPDNGIIAKQVEAIEKAVEILQGAV